jgi:hypothetical protein
MHVFELHNLVISYFRCSTGTCFTWRLEQVIAARKVQTRLARKAV